MLSFSLLAISCSSEDEKRTEAPLAEVEFELVFPNVSESTKAISIGETPWLNYAACTNGFDEDGQPIPTDVNRLKAHIKLQKKNKSIRSSASPDILEQEVNIIRRGDDTHVTESIVLDANTEYQLTDILVKGTDPLNPIVYFSGVNEGSELAAYTTCTLPYTFTVLPFKKHLIEFPILCARGISSDAFGKPKFSIHNIEISCIPLFVDICNNAGESFVANGNISLKKLLSHNKPAVEDFKNLDAIITNLESGEITYFCISDNLGQNDKFEWQLIELNYNDPNDNSKTKTIQEIVSLDVIKQYQQFENWDHSYNFLDVRICGENKCIFNCNQ